MTKKERLEKYLKYKGIKPTAFARALGISNSHISEINTRKNNRTLYLAIQSSPDFLDLNTEWIDTGEGEMRSQPRIAEAQEGYARQILSEDEDYLLRTYRKLHSAEKEKVIEIAELYSGVKESRRHDGGGNGSQESNSS
jgi:transcriptional regulator with XRE-family HTH domain